MHPWPLPATAMRSVPSSACLCALLMGVGGSPLESLGWKAPERTVLRARDEGEHAGLWHSVGRGMENADESRWSAAADAWVSADTLRVIKCSALGRRREGPTTTLRLPRRTLFCLFFASSFAVASRISFAGPMFASGSEFSSASCVCLNSFFRARVLGSASCSAGCLRRRAVSLLAPPPPEDIEDGGVGFGFPRCCLSTTYLSSAARSRRSKRCAVTILFPPFFVAIYYSV